MNLLSTSSAMNLRRQGSSRFRNACRGTLSIFVLLMLVLSGFLPLISIGASEELDSDYDGWSDDHERTMGTDPYNPDTDGDGIEDPDDPTPKGSLINEEELWETFDYTITPSQELARVGQELEIKVTVEKEGIPIAGRELTFYIFLDGEKWLGKGERTRTLVDGDADFDFKTSSPGRYTFVAVMDSQTVSLGHEVSSNELREIASRKQGAYLDFTIYEEFRTTITSHYRKVLVGQEGSFHIKLWEYSEDKAVEYTGRNPGTEDIYTAVSGNVDLSVALDDREEGSYRVFVSEEGSNWSHLFGEPGYHYIAAHPDKMNSNWAESPWKFSYAYCYLRVEETLVDWVSLPDRPKVLEQHEITVHRGYLDPAMGAELYDGLARKYTQSQIASIYPEHVLPWSGTVHTTLLYRNSRFVVQMKQESLEMEDGTGTMSFSFYAPGSYNFCFSFTRVLSFPEDHKVDYYDYVQHHSLSFSSSYISVGTELTTSVFSSQQSYFTGEDCEIAVTTLEGGQASNTYPVALYLDNGFWKTATLPASGTGEYSFDNVGAGDRNIIAVPLFSEATRTLVEIMGVSQMAGSSWFGGSDIYVRNLAIYTHLPYRLVKGLQAPLRIIVYGEGYLPVSDAQVEVDLIDTYYGSSVRSRREVASGTTDESGTFSPVITVPENDHFDHFEIKVTKDGRSETVRQSISLRSEDLGWSLTLNKPLYRGGDTIHARFLVWNADSVEPVQAPEIEVRLMDPYDRTVARTEVSSDAYGQGSFEFSLPSKLPWGRYTLRLEFEGNSYSKNFHIKEYDTPETYISFSESPEEAEEGKEVTVPLELGYLFGAPVTEGTVEFTVTKYQPYYYYDYYYPMERVLVFEDDDEGDDEESFPIHQTVEVEQGWANLTFTVPENAGTMRIDAVFSDSFGHSNSASRTLRSTAAPAEGVELDVDMNDSRILPGEEPICTVTATRNEEGVSGLELEITITVKNVMNDEVKVFSFQAETEGENGEYVFDVRDKLPYQDLLEDYFLEFSISASTTEDPVVGSNTDSFRAHRIRGELRTDGTDYQAGDDVTISFGEFDLLLEEWRSTNFTLELSYQKPYDREYVYWGIGYSYIPAFASSGYLEDEEGEIIFSVPGSMPTGLYRLEVNFDFTTVYHSIQLYTVEQRIEISCEDESYQAGTDVQVQINTTNAQGKWLYVDVVTGPSLLSYSVLLDTDNVVLDIPTDDHRHDLELTAYFITDSGAILSDELSLEQEFSEMNILLETDKESYGPGDTLYLNLTVTDEEGNPVPDLLVGVSMVDSAVFELESDSRESSFFSSFRHPYARERNYDLRANYLSFPFTPQELKERRTVLWDGDLRSDSKKNGSGGAGGGAPEADSSNSNYESRDLYTMPEEAVLGDDLGQALEEADIREDFRETAFWLPGLEMENGSYSWEIKLPDNLARWQLKTLVSTEDCRGEMEVINFNSSKDFFIDVTIPHRVVQDDEFVLVSRIHNFGEEELDISVGLTAGPWLKVFGENEKNITMAAGSVREMEFRIKVMKNGIHNLTLIATDFGENTDAVKRNMVVRPNGALKTTHLSGSVEDSITETVSYLPELVADSQETVLRLVVGYEGLLEAGAGMLGGYPYECTEQLMSVLLPNVLLYEYYELTGELSWRMRQNYQRNINHGVLKLLGNQHPDGGWGWWETDDTDAFMTAYVLFGFSRTRDAGLHVSPQVIEEAQEAIMARMNGDGFWATAPWMEDNHIIMALYVNYALAVSGFGRTDLATSLDALEDAWKSGEIDDPYELALYTLLLQELGEDDSQAVGKLLKAKTVSHWQAGSSLGGGDETTAWAAYALQRTGENKAAIRGSLEWLAGQRSPGGGWGTTSDTIAALILINEVLKDSERPDMDVTVKVDGESLISMHVDGSYESQHEFRSALDAFDLDRYLETDKESEITIERSGTGDLFYELTTVQYLRKGIELDYKDEVTAKEDKEFTVKLELDPEKSKNVKISGVELRIPKHDDLLLVSSEQKGEEDKKQTFTFNYIGEEAGEYTLGPILVSYTLDSGERKSAAVREYFYGINVTLESKEGGRSRSGEPGRSDDPGEPGEESELSVLKLLSQNPAVVGEEIEVRIFVSAPESLQGESFRLEDRIPEGFAAFGDHPGLESRKMVVDFQGAALTQFSYTLTAREKFTGKLSRALVYQEEDLVSYSRSPKLEVIPKTGMAVVRSYSSQETALNGVVTVDLHLRSPAGLSYAAVEDILLPGARVLEDSVGANLDDNVLSYALSGDKLVFFIAQVEALTLSYQFIPTITGEFALAPALLYGMYDTETTAESDSVVLSVSEEFDPEEGPDSGTFMELMVTLEEIPETFSAGTEANVAVLVHNFGTRDAWNVPVSLYVDGVLVWREGVNLAAHSSKLVNLPWTPTEGDHDISVVVDDQGLFAEENTENNAVDFNTGDVLAEEEAKDGVSGALYLLLSIFAVIILLFLAVRPPGQVTGEEKKEEE